MIYHDFFSDLNEQLVKWYSFFLILCLKIKLCIFKINQNLISRFQFSRKNNEFLKGFKLSTENKKKM